MMTGAPSRMANPEFRGRMGVARQDITPPVGIHSRTWGSARHEVAEGVHRPLLATCLALSDSDGGNELFLITLDALVFWSLGAQQIRNAVQNRFNLRPEQVIFHPSHSHSSPFMDARHLSKPGGDLIGPYLERMPGLCCDLIVAARAAAVSGTLSWAYGRCALAFNRDALDAATGRDICGLNLLESADDTVLVGRAMSDGGKVIATLVNYACHPVSLGGGNRLLSPDYIGSMREVVERETGGAPCLFLHGASGDLTPRRSYEADVAAAEQNGKELGYAAMAALTSLFPPGQRLEYEGIEESGTPLGRWRLHPKQEVATAITARVATARLQLRPMPSRREIEEKLAVATERYEIERLERTMARRIQVGDEDWNSFTFTIWRLGDGFVVSTSAEPYSRFQLELRKRFPDIAIAVLNLSDGTTTYLPRPAAFERDVYQSRIAFYEPKSLELVTAAACDAIATMITSTRHDR
ncbi:MAG: hypothetical protein JSR66_23115 [Proteobacteria bacterium]|nr:hypothetical protein [Pseudomonadota bacterium]